MNFQYCPDCGRKLGEKQIGDEGLVPFCLFCEKPFFSFSYPCVICLVIEGEQVALIKQSYVSDRYVCVAGYVKQGETIEETAKREVEEETGLPVSAVQYINSYYYPKGDNLMFGFVCTVKNSGFKLSSEVDEADWFTFREAESRLREGSVGKNLLRDYLSGQIS